MTLSDRLRMAERKRARAEISPLDEVILIVDHAARAPRPAPHPYMVAAQRAPRRSIEFRLASVRGALASRRARPWRDTDPDRTRLLEGAEARLSAELEALDQEAVG